MENLKEYIEYAVIAILLLMSIVTVAIAMERLLFYKKIDLKSFKTKNEAEIGLSNNLSLLSIIGSNAPYVGLLGTVFGIMVVFYDMGMSEKIDPNVIVVGLSMALKVTAIGLLVAIPATMIYSGYLRTVDKLMARWEDEVA
ncbi:MAG: TonB-system energizer ExbB [Campylobacterota bacterium]